MVLQRREAIVHTIGLSLCWRQDLAEEGQPLIPLSEPEGVHHSRHIDHLTGTHGMPHDRHNLKHLQHNACKGTNNLAKRTLSEENSSVSGQVRSPFAQ